jgi:hypothetical protein
MHNFFHEAYCKMIVFCTLKIALVTKLLEQNLAQITLPEFYTKMFQVVHPWHKLLHRILSSAFDNF